MNPGLAQFEWLRLNLDTFEWPVDSDFSRIAVTFFDAVSRFLHNKKMKLQDFLMLDKVDEYALDYWKEE